MLSIFNRKSKNSTMQKPGVRTVAVAVTMVARTAVMILRTTLKALLLLAILGTAGAGAHPKHLHHQVLPPATFPPPTTARYFVVVDANPAHALNRFSPDTTFGGGVDGVPFHAVPEIYTPSNVRQMPGADGARSYPSPDGPPSTTIVSGRPGTDYTLPAESLTVLTGPVGAR